MTFHIFEIARHPELYRVTTPCHRRMTLFGGGSSFVPAVLDLPTPTPTNIAALCALCDGNRISSPCRPHGSSRVP